ncbi:MAG: M20/M25/M40 family metallo-hydrolase [Proteobacteria bacterium]|nr:M20/M25/M40 family metallo-hydrolase [Pseudomonadota bacterium]
MRHGILWAGLSLGSHLMTTAVTATPVKVLHGAASIYSVPPESVLYHEDDLVVVRDSGASSFDFNDLYVVNMSHRTALPDDISQFGKVVHFEPARFALMNLDEGRVAELSGRLHSEGLACGVLLKLDGSGIQPKMATAPKAIIPVGAQDNRASALITRVNEKNIRNDINELSAIPTRFHKSATGRNVADYLLGKYKALRGNRSDVTVSTFDHGSDTAQRSLVVRIKGKVHPDEVIVLGSHLDSVNWQDGVSQRAPGADDNASGTATNLEIFRILMEGRAELDRSLEIHAYAAEEIGLVGSQNMARAYRSKGTNIIAMMQIDMDLYKDASETDKIWFVTNNTNDAFNNALGNLVDLYIGLPWEKRSLSGGSSDHAAWHREGFAAAFPFENPDNHNPHIHTADDTIENSGAFSLAAGFAKLGLAYVAHFGGVLK